MNDMIKDWVERFSTYVNLSAKHGPYSKVAQTLHKDEIKEAMSTITWQTKCQIYNRQTSCRHAKSGKYNPLKHRDYAITTHTFIDSKTRLKCMLCGTEAWSDSGMNFKFEYLKSLAESSSNRPSASEQVLLEVTQGKVVLATFPNTDEGRAALRKRFPNWDGTYAQPVYDPPKQNDSVAIPEGHSPIKGMKASTPEPGPESPGAIIVTALDDLLYKEQK